MTTINNQPNMTTEEGKEHYDDMGVLCRYIDDEWYAIEDHCVTCGYRCDECECDEGEEKWVYPCEECGDCDEECDCEETEKELEEIKKELEEKQEKELEEIKKKQRLALLDLQFAKMTGLINYSAIKSFSK